MGELEALFDQGTGGRSHKWRHYFAIYERYLTKFKSQQCVYVEIGIERGGTLDIMQKFLGEKARIIGVDIDARCKEIEKNGHEIHIGDQGNTQFMRNLRNQIGPIDIVVDDGGHTPDQQITTFYELWPYLKPGGIYLVEDLHANLWASHQHSRYGITFFDLAKSMADKMSYWHLDPKSFDMFRSGQKVERIENFVTNQVYGIHFYDSVIVFEKRDISPPVCERK